MKDDINDVKRRKKMATQIQDTPTLYGCDAKDVINDVLRKPSKKQKEKLCAKYKELFTGVKTKEKK